MASKMACYGLSQTQIANVLERDVRTVEEWLQARLLTKSLQNR
jgi:DNA-binding transcriptional regulator YiaG